MNIKIRKLLLSIVAVILLGIFGYGGYYVYSIYDFGRNIGDGDSVLDEYERNLREQNPDAYVAPEPPKWEGTERVNILLLGGDARGVSKNDAPRSDTIMVASIDPETKQAYLFSILRDTYTQIPGHYTTRINAAMALGGPSLAMETVGEFLGLDIQYYVFVDFQGFIDLVDAIGGVEFEVEKDLYYYDPTDANYGKINLKKGLQVLDGDKALQYVRFRHDRMGDYTRTERQREFLKAVAKKLTSTSSLLTLPNTLKKIEPHITTNIPVNKMLPLARLALDSSGNEIITAQLPPMELLREEKINGLDVITVNKKTLQDHVQELFSQVSESTDIAADGGSSNDSDVATNSTGTADNSNSTTNAGNNIRSNSKLPDSPTASNKLRSPGY